MAAVPDRHNLENPEDWSAYHESAGLMAGVCIPLHVVGAYSFEQYSCNRRDTKDLFLFVRRDDLQDVLGCFSGSGYRTELTYPHWLAKAFLGGYCIDIIFNLGNG